MKTVRLLAVAVRHGYRVWRAGQLRFRLETFGLYYPALPYRNRWWQISLPYVLMLLRQTPSYIRWIAEMEELRHQGANAWWERRHK